MEPDPPPGPAAPGARDRRKRETRQALSRAAIEIVNSEGFDSLTAERIAEAAGVSRRTLFNYFPRVEDVLTATIEDATDETIAAFLARPADEPLREAVRAVLESLFSGPVFAQARALEQAAVRSHATRRFLREFADRQAEAMEEGLLERIGPDADPVYVAALAASASAVLSRLTRLAVAAGGDDAQIGAHHQAWCLRAVDQLFAGFDEADATTTTSTTTTDGDA